MAPELTKRYHLLIARYALPCPPALIAGILAKWIMPGKDGGGFFVTVILGVIGAMVGGWISTLFGFGKVDGFNFGSFAVAVIGALVVLFIYRKIKS